MQSQLVATESELEKQRTLNEKLENDLLQMDQRKTDGGINGTHSPANGASASTDALAGIDLGKKTVRISDYYVVWEPKSDLRIGHFRKDYSYSICSFSGYIHSTYRNQPARSVQAEEC